MNQVAKQLICWATLAVALPTASAFSQEAKFADPLDTPARLVERASSRPLLAVTSTGPRLVAVGSRGLIVYSNDSGKTWLQANVPVQCDLLAVQFVNAKTGWSVGHDGVILRSDDGGQSWKKTFDVRLAAESFRRYYEEQQASNADASANAQTSAGPADGEYGEQGGESPALSVLDQVARNVSLQSALPYLDVWFESPDVGYVVGSYGLLATTRDGGETWMPWLERIDSEQLNLNAIRPIGEDLFIVGEQGKIYRLDRQAERFVRIDTGYAGSFFGLASNGNEALAFGLRGVTYRSADKGRSWHQVDSPSNATIAAGSALPSGKGFLLVNDAGQLIVVPADGSASRMVDAKQRMRFTGVRPLSNGRVALTGLGGVAVEDLPETGL